MSQVCAQKLARLQAIVAERAGWAEQLRQVKRLHGWLLEVEHLLDRSLLAQGEEVNNATVGIHLDQWRERMRHQLTEGEFAPLEQECLREFLQVLANLRPYLVQCYDRQDFPRTNNDMERSIRSLKTQYRRVSGRKNWNAYLLRYGRCVAYASWWDRGRWRQLRRETSRAHHEQLTRFRFRHKRQALLASLEDRWATSAQSVPLP